jgi:hypothetical protein
VFASDESTHVESSSVDPAVDPATAAGPDSTTDTEPSGNVTASVEPAEGSNRDGPLHLA